MAVAVVVGGRRCSQPAGQAPGRRCDRDRDYSDCSARLGAVVVWPARVPTRAADEPWLSRGVAEIGTAGFLADVGHEVPSALLPSLVTSTLGSSAASLGLIESVSDGLAGAARLAGGAIPDDPTRRKSIAIGGYTATAVLSSLTGWRRRCGA